MGGIAGNVRSLIIARKGRPISRLPAPAPGPPRRPRQKPAGQSALLLSSFSTRDPAPAPRSLPVWARSPCSSRLPGRREWWRPGAVQLRTPGEAVREHIRTAIDLRRGLDLLIAQPGADPERIGLVGHHFGALIGRRPDDGHRKVCRRRHPEPARSAGRKARTLPPDARGTRSGRTHPTPLPVPPYDGSRPGRSSGPPVPGQAAVLLPNQNFVIKDSIIICRIHITTWSGVMRDGSLPAPRLPYP